MSTPQPPGPRPRLNILALPSHTAILFGLIAVVALGPALAALLPGSRLWWPPIVLGLTLLPLRDFLHRPDRRLAERGLTAPADGSDAPIRRELAGLAPEGAAVQVVTTPRPQPLEAFGSFRRRYVGMSEHLAAILARNLAGPTAANRPRYRAMLAHELAHFLNQDVRLVWLSYAFLKMLVLVMAVNLWTGLLMMAFLIQFGPEIFSVAFWSSLSQHFSSLMPMLPPVDLTPILDAFVAQDPQRIARLADPTAQASNYSAFLLYVVGAQWPFALCGAVLLFVYWPRLLAVREMYADARAAALVGDSSLIPQAVRLHAQDAGWHAAAQGRRERLAAAIDVWLRRLPFAQRGLRTLPAISPERLASLEEPLVALGSWQRLAVATGLAVALVSFTMASSLTAGQLTEPGSQLPFLILFLACATWLLPHLCAGELARGRALASLIVRLVALAAAVALAPRLLDGLLILVQVLVNAEGFGRLVDLWAYGLAGAGGGALPPLMGVEVSWADLLSLHVVRPLLYYALLLPPVWVGLLWLDARLKQRALLWYGLGRGVKRAFFGSTAALAGLGWLVILPLLNRLVFPEIYPTVAPAEALAAALALAAVAVGLVAFRRTDRRQAHICPTCGARVAGAHQLGAFCDACGARLHGWLVAPYADRGLR